MTENNEKMEEKSGKLSKSKIESVVFRVLYLSGIFMFLVSVYVPWYKIDIANAGNSFSYILLPFDGWIRNAVRYSDQYNVPEWNLFRSFFILITIISVILFVNIFLHIQNEKKFKNKKEIYQMSYYISASLSILFLIFLFNNKLPFPTGLLEINIGNSNYVYNYSMQYGYFLCLLSPIIIKLGYEGLYYVYEKNKQDSKKSSEFGQLSNMASMTSLDKLLLLRQMESNLKNSEDFKKTVKELIET